MFCTYNTLTDAFCQIERFCYYKIRQVRNRGEKSLDIPFDLNIVFIDRKIFVVVGYMRVALNT